MRIVRKGEYPDNVVNAYMEYIKGTSREDDVVRNYTTSSMNEAIYTIEKNYHDIEVGNRMSTAFRLYFDSGRTQTYIAKLLGVSSKTINGYINKMIRMLFMNARYRSILENEEAPEMTLVTPITKTTLSVRTMNAIIRSCSGNGPKGIPTIYDVCTMDFDKIRKIRNLGDSSLNELLTFMRNNGFSFAPCSKFGTDCNNCKFFSKKFNKCRKDVIDDSPNNVEDFVDKCMLNGSDWRMNSRLMQQLPHMVKDGKIMFTPKEVRLIQKVYLILRNMNEGHRNFIISAVKTVRMNPDKLVTFNPSYFNTTDDLCIFVEFCDAINIDTEIKFIYNLQEVRLRLVRREI